MFKYIFNVIMREKVLLRQPTHEEKMCGVVTAGWETAH
jgi:hypothetical protein